MPGSVELVVVDAELGVLPGLDAVGEVCQIPADQALGLALGREQRADLGDKLEASKPWTVVAFAEGSEPGVSRIARRGAGADERRTV